MIKLVLVRVGKEKDRTLGRLEVYKDLAHLASFVTLELPGLNNARRVSCIPTGTYPIEAEDHPKFGKCFRVHNVRDRDGILIHRGNYPSDTLGCILPGMNFADIDKDGTMDVSRSTQALDMLWVMVPDTAELTIV